MSELTGYRREDGSTGIRNHLLVLSSVVCANVAAEKIARRVPGAVALTHQHGCAQLGEDRDQTRRTLVGFGSHPNVRATLVVGLGCEAIQPDTIAQAITEAGRPAEVLTIQKCGGVSATVEHGTSLLNHLAEKTERTELVPIAWKDLILATECGGSDATSGLAANPAVGSAADAVVREGGTVILSETMEMVGAEHLLAARAETPVVAGEIRAMVQRAEEAALAMGEDIRGAQPAPGNIAGGITTIEEKSLGCIFKGGTTPIREVVRYAARPDESGLVIMDTPGHDVESVTGMVAGGAQAVVFTTGRGTPTGCPIAPVIKVTANDRAARNMSEHIDVDLSDVIRGQIAVPEAGDRLLAQITRTIRRERTRSEMLGHGEFAIHRTGPSV